MKSKCLLGFFALLSLCSCTIFGNKSRTYYLNQNNKIDFFQEEWKLLYDYNFEHNPGYYVYDCSNKKPKIDDFNTTRDAIFEERMAFYISYIGEYLERNPKEKNNSDIYKPEMIVNFDDEYVWKWYLEVEEGRSIDYTKAADDPYYEEESLGIYDQIFIVYHENTSTMYVCNWYC